MRTATGDTNAVGDVAVALTGIGRLAGTHNAVCSMANGLERDISGADGLLATAGNNAAKARVVARAIEEAAAKFEPVMVAIR